MDHVAAIQRKVAAVSNVSCRVKFRENVANIFLSIYATDSLRQNMTKIVSVR